MLLLGARAFDLVVEAPRIGGDRALHAAQQASRRAEPTTGGRCPGCMNGRMVYERIAKTEPSWPLVCAALLTRCGPPGED
jgi:hypothetical protein